MKTTLTSEPWVIHHKPNPQAGLRLFCFHYLAGGASVFRRWPDNLPLDIEVCAVQLPGRENRIDEPPFKHLTPLIETLTKVLLTYLDRPFAFYGHSMGALLSFELARKLSKQHGLSPAHLFVAAYFAPHLLSPLQLASSDEFTDAALLKKSQHVLEASKSILEDTEAIQKLLPTMKADSLVLRSYDYSDEEPLDCPISAFAGSQDGLVSYDATAAWHQHTCSTFKLVVLPGKHLFLMRSRKLLLQIMSQDLIQVMTQIKSRGKP